MSQFAYRDRRTIWRNGAFEQVLLITTDEGVTRWSVGGELIGAPQLVTSANGSRVAAEIASLNGEGGDATYVRQT